MGENLFGICFETIARANMLGQLKREYKHRILLIEGNNNGEAK